MATNKEVKLLKVNTLPGSGYEADAIYLEASGTDYLNFYVANSDGSAVKRIPKFEEIKTEIQSKFDEVFKVYNDYSTLTGLEEEEKKKIKFAYVIDASGDSTVDSGGAFYARLSESADFTKVAESESFNEINISGAKSWSELTGKPTSTPTKIDEAVTKMHSHANKDVLDKFSESSGKLMYDGKEIIAKLEWTNAEW